MGSPVVLGLGGCVDYELKLTAPTLRRLVADYRIGAAELGSPGPVTGERELVVSILGFLRTGGGGERFVASADAIRTFADRFPRRETVGGTAVRAAIAMSRLGVPSTLHLVSLNDTIRGNLPADCDYVCSGTADTLYPHLIVEYDRDLRVRVGDIDIRAPFPNRLIYVNDPANESMLLSDEWGGVLRDARVFLISGFNAVRDETLLDRRLATLRGHMRQLSPEAVVYYEDAGFHQPEFSRRVRAALLDDIDVYGLNEDEMRAHLGHPVDLLSVPAVAAALTSLRTVIPVSTLVVHTKYWSAAVGRRAGEYARALDDGIVIASTRYRHGDGYDDAQYAAMLLLPRRAAAGVFAAALEARMGTVVRCVPGFRLDVAEPTTVGLGDTFVGGFLAAIARDAVSATSAERPGRRRPTPDADRSDPARPARPGRSG
jgi:ADP-dependent phosphofructokinase/glucokinase